MVGRMWGNVSIVFKQNISERTCSYLCLIFLSAFSKDQRKFSKWRKTVMKNVREKVKTSNSSDNHSASTCGRIFQKS